MIVKTSILLKSLLYNRFRKFILLWRKTCFIRVTSYTPGIDLWRRNVLLFLRQNKCFADNVNVSHLHFATFATGCPNLNRLTWINCSTTGEWFVSFHQCWQCSISFVLLDKMLEEWFDARIYSGIMLDFKRKTTQNFSHSTWMNKIKK